MSVAAARGASNATIHLPLGQLAVVGLGAFCVSNPDKFFGSLTKGLQFMSSASAALNPNSGHQSSSQQHQQPIVVYQPAAVSGTSYKGYVIQLLLSAGLCWGTYVVLVKVLPEQAKGMLPVTTSRFNRSITSLGRAVINLKDTLMQQINALSEKQDSLSGKQDETLEEVLNVRDNVEEMRGDISNVTDSLKVAHTSLAESERRISYIARGVQLLTRGVSTFLPEDEGLLHELVQFNLQGDEFNMTSPDQQQRLQQALQTIQQQANNNRNGNINNFGSNNYIRMPHLTIRNDSDENSADPENEVPSSPTSANVESSVTDIHALLREHGINIGNATTPQRSRG